MGQKDITLALDAHGDGGGEGRTRALDSDAGDGQAADEGDVLAAGVAFRDREGGVHPRRERRAAVGHQGGEGAEWEGCVGGWAGDDEACGEGEDGVGREGRVVWVGERDQAAGGALRRCVEGFDGWQWLLC